QINRAALGQPQESKLFNLFHATIGFSYDLDLSGGVRRGLEALAAQVDEKNYRLAGARLAVAGNVVTTCLAQAQIRGQIRIVEDILAVQQEQLDLGRKRFSLGVVSEHEVLALQSQFEETRALLPALRRQLEQTNDLLAVLVGQSPAEAAVPAFSLDDFHLPTELPVSLPSELVRQRPDIQSSEALLQAAVAQHGVSVARLYPRLALSVDMGTQALTIGGLFDDGSMIWSLAGNLTQPLFNKGLRAEARAAEAGIDAAAAAYRQTVLQAFVEVADVLRALESNTQTLDARYAAHQSALKTLNLVRRQHELGAVSYIDVLIAQRQSLQAQEALLSIQGQRLIDTAALYQSMGGGLLVSATSDALTRSMDD
ncbi:MAG: efflux transporter outer membrane subunit, partial [Clostridia bacterium]|nr:efflux transporter outer membrane subunit [Clostridia bacterium]